MNMNRSLNLRPVPALSSARTSAGSSLRFLATLVLLMALLSSCARHQPEPVDMTLDDAINSQEEFQRQILDFPGPALVLFYNDQYWQSVEMEKRYTLFRERYGNQIRFRRYPWNPEEDATPYGLELLPTVILFHAGQEVDRIKGIPVAPKELADWNRDLDLWLRKTGLAEQGDEYSAQFTYRFNNSIDLQMSNF